MKLPFCGIYDGSLEASERQALLDEFSALENGALLASMRAAGEGLTLVEANHVVLINRWWNPSANQQAIDRVHRIGQRKPVTVHWLEAVNTLDERLTKMLGNKEERFEEVIGRLRQGLATPKGSQPKA